MIESLSRDDDGGNDEQSCISDDNVITQALMCCRKPAHRRLWFACVNYRTEHTHPLTTEATEEKSPPDDPRSANQSDWSGCSGERGGREKLDNQQLSAISYNMDVGCRKLSN